MAFNVARASVTLNANPAGLQSGLGRARSMLTSFASRAMKILAPVTGILSTVGGGFGLKIAAEVEQAEVALSNLV
jgi:hypothetical protein